MSLGVFLENRKYVFFLYKWEFIDIKKNWSKRQIWSVPPLRVQKISKDILWSNAKKPPPFPGKEEEYRI